MVTDCTVSIIDDTHLTADKCSYEDYASLIHALLALKTENCYSIAYVTVLTLLL